MTESEMFVKDVQNNKMTPINILNWYRNFYRSENNNTEQGIMANAINDIFMRLTDMGLSNDERLLMSNEEYRNKGKYKIPSKHNDNTLEINGKLLALIDIIFPTLDPYKEVSYNLGLLANELNEERNRIEREELI